MSVSLTDTSDFSRFLPSKVINDQTLKKRDVMYKINLRNPSQYANITANENIS